MTEVVTPPGAAPAAAGITAELERLCATVLDPLLAMAETVAAALPSGRRPRLAELDAVRPPALAQLRRADDLVAGSGLIADPALIVDAPWHLAWWTRGRDGITPLRVVSDPARDGFRDYTVLEWWTVPHRTGRPHITGPYVDYLCTDAYTLTFTVPVRGPDASVAGVVGSDVYVARMERMLLPVLRACGRPATVVNRTGRVVVSTHPAHTTGFPIRARPAGWLRHDSPAVPFSVLIGAQRASIST
ncbi:cache domain-containing protein [Actinoplanes sp. NPDC049599]|uniref:cache domain-containing protein n=1 Tax=Actinoplanes sp. NPDC049599 TaxID=3363903 RepID=UPI0037A7CF67